MKDQRGIYYYPDLNDRTTRMYVRENSLNEIEFRLYVESKPEIWEKHEWIPYEVVEKAQNLYQKERHADSKNLNLYDIKIAKSLIEYEAQKTNSTAD